MTGFWNWMGTTASGNLAQWIGGLGTTGALLLGFYILRRDQASKEREQVSQLMFDRTHYMSGPRFKLTNHSSRPILARLLIVRSLTAFERITDRRQRKQEKGKELAYMVYLNCGVGDDPLIVPAGADAWADLTDLPEIGTDVWNLKQIVIATDAQGIMWRIDVGTERGAITGSKSALRELRRYNKIAEAMVRRRRREGILSSIKTDPHDGEDKAGDTQTTQ